MLCPYNNPLIIFILVCLNLKVCIQYQESHQASLNHVEERSSQEDDDITHVVEAVDTLVLEDSRNNNNEVRDAMDYCRASPSIETIKEAVSEKVIEVGASMWQCRDCSYSSMKRGNVTKHAETHVNSTYVCTECDTSLKSKQSFRNHFKRFHA